MYMLVAFLALLAFLGGFGGKSAKNVECARDTEYNMTPNYRTNQLQITEKFNAKLPKIEIID